MHTPEPRPLRGSGGGSDGGPASVTPRVDSNGVTPTPWAGFLRRGGNGGSGGDALQDAIAAGPSVLFDEETGTATAADASPQPSQLTQQQPLYNDRSRLPRQRPRFHTVQDLDVALNQAIEGKINSRNAWASKEASDLLEGITHTIETTLDAASVDDYSGFAKAATVVEGCSKVWTSRVDSTYQQSNQMVQRLLRKDEASGKRPTGDGDDDAGGSGEEGDEQQRKKSRSRSVAAASNAATRTLAMEATEINLDSKSRTALTQTGINAQFRAITSKFDQGNAQGLLMNNAPMGRAGNIILDVDYSVIPVPAAVSGGSRQGSRRVSGTNVPPPRGSGCSEGQETQAELATPSRVSQHAAVELDTAVYEAVADLPPYLGVMAAVSPTGQLRGTRGSESFPQMRDTAGGSSSAGDLRGSQASLIDPLLLLPHSSPAQQELSDLARVPVRSSAQEGYNTSGVAAEATGEVRTRNTLHSDGAAAAGGDGATRTPNDTPLVQETEDGHTAPLSGEDDFDDGGGACDDDDGSAYHSSEADISARPNREGGDRGAEARRLVSGAAEMELIDTLFHGQTQLALEAEDPASWCPLSDVSANPLAGVRGLSELSRLHREHRFAQSPRGAGGDDAGRIQNSGELGSTMGSPLGAQLQPAAKRGRKERTVVFQLPPSPTSGGGAGTNGATSATSTFSTESRLLLDDGALRQATTAARNITPLGKQLLLAKDAAHAVLAYTQSAVQRSKAEEMGLLLPEAPIPGKTIPSYMPFPVRTQEYFQPFSTSLTHWNLLRKSATGHLVDTTAGARSNEGASSSVMARDSSSGITADRGRHSGLAPRTGDYFGTEALDQDSYGGARSGYGDDNMPVEFFPGGAEVEAQDGGEAGGDYADYADLYGPDDDHSDEEEEQRYVQGGFRSSSDARLVADVAAAAAAASGSVGATISNGSSSRTSGAGSDALLGDPLELLKVLSPPEATIPSQVDVVKLRQLMWEALQGHLAANGQVKAVNLATLDAGPAAGASKAAAGEGSTNASARANRTGAAVKAHAQVALNMLRKRARPMDECEDAQPANSGKDAPPSPLLLAESTATAAPAAAATPAEVAPTRFSDVVRSVLPHISAVSSTNTLSPAFFFFSILFLANEHSVVLKSAEGLDDLVACGIAGCAGE
ncbi:hypothetical protein LSCM1_07958 [Leishmania martiniquensis]|uniref:Condensin complex subunit 2 n=1 Tax=Leishmania martiniquensis TaxID=1580590 RepID=A0A836H6E4_9TRYP|nr:hypothetical protein LSCM1_07958 [Leishmania martiniquensis]